MSSLILKGGIRLYHMEADLGLVGNQYQIAVSILFVTYVVRFHISPEKPICNP